MLPRSKDAFTWAIRSYWDYYCELEEELVRTRRYVTFSEANFKAFSMEYLKLYEAACGEVDVLLKVLAACADSSFDAKHAHLYKSWFVVQHRYDYGRRLWDLEGACPAVGVSLCDAECTFSETVSIKPWQEFEVEQYQDKNGATRYRALKGKRTPQWWSDYNKVKHHRMSLNPGDQSENYRLANLKNVASAFAGLYVLEYALLKTVGTQDDLEGFVDTTRLFTERPSFVTSREIDDMFIS